MSVVGGAGVGGGLQVLEQHHLLLEAAAPQHAGRPAAVGAAGTVRQAAAHAAQPAAGVEAAGRGEQLQPDGGGGVLPLEALRKGRGRGRGHGRGHFMEVMRQEIQIDGTRLLVPVWTGLELIHVRSDSGHN